MASQPSRDAAPHWESNRSFGRLLHEALTAKGWTQARLARELHVDPTTVSHWRRGHRPAPELATKIEELLGCEPGSLRRPLEQEIREHDRRTTTGRRRFWTDQACPYRGLLAFREEDAPFFHGRGALTAKLVEAVRRHALVGVIGSSGSGKSSLVFAGLIPSLHEEGDWRIVSFRPGSRPFRALAAAFVSLREPPLSEADKRLEINRLAAAFQRGELGLEEVMIGGERLLVVVDQLEELFTSEATAEESRRFIDILVQAGRSAPVQQETASLRVVTTLRADFLGQALNHRLLRDALQQASLMVGPMTREELRDAIEKPASRLHVTIEEGLVDRILDAVGDEPGQLPLLEFALARLWEGKQGGQITHEAYDRMGGVEQALSGFAEDVYGGLCEKHRQRAARVFLQLVRPGEGTHDTRRVATRAEVGEEDWNLVTCLASSRLVVTGREEGTGRETVELVHEALITHWECLRKWMEADRRFRLWQERLRSGLRQWEASGRDEGALLRGGPLAEAMSWRASRGNDLSPAEARFIEASASAAEQVEREKEALRQYELAAARRRTRRLRVFSAVLIVLLLVAASMSMVAMQQANSARQQQDLASARLLAAQATANRDHHPLSLLLALESLGTVPTNEAWAALQWGLRHSRHNVLALTDHEGPVVNVAQSPDGSIVASASNDGTVRLWDVAARKQIGEPLTGHSGPVRGVAFSPDGQTIASASEDDTVRLWDVATGKPIGEPLRGHMDDANDVAFSPDGTKVASASADFTVRLWEVATGKPIGEPLMHATYVNGVAFSPDGKTIASASAAKPSADFIVRLWDVATGKPIGEPLRGHTFWVNDVAFSPDGKTIASAGADFTVRLWDVATGKPIGEPLSGHTSFVNDVAFSPDGKTIASASADFTVRLWDVATGKPDGEPLTGHTSFVEGVAFGRDTVASAGEDGTVRLWEIGTAKPIGEPLSGTPPPPIRGRVSAVNSVAFSPYGKTVASAGPDHLVRLWEVAMGKLIGEPLRGHASFVNSVAFSPDGRTVASGSDDRTVRLWEVATGKPIGEPMVGHASGVSDVAFSPDGKTVASASDDGTLRFWDVVTRKQIGEPLRGHSGPIKATAFSPDGKTLASAGEDATVRLWEVATGKRVGEPLRGHVRPVHDVAFSPDGKTIASAGADFTVRLWDVATGKPDGEPLTGHTNFVHSVAFSPDGTTIASASSDHTVRLWDLATGEQVGDPLRGHVDWVGGVAFSPDGQMIASASSDHRVRLWPGEMEAWVERACANAGRNLTQREWNQYVPDRPYARTCSNMPSGPDAPPDAPGSRVPRHWLPRTGR